MQPSDNIYHEENVPFLARRRKRRGPPRVATVGPASGTSPGTESSPYSVLYHEQGERVASADNGRGGPNHGRRRHHRHSRDSRSLGSRLLWFSLVLILAVYVTVLGITMLRPPGGNTNNAEPGSAANGGSAAAAVGENGAGKPEKGIEALIQDWDAARKSLEVAGALADQEQYEAAAARLEQALKTSPENLAMNMTLAGVYAAQKRHGQAMDLLLHILKTDPQHAAARQLLARLLLAQKQDADALAMAKWIIEADAYSVEAHDIAATVYMNMQKPGWAIPHLRKIINLEPENYAAQNKLALAYSQQGEYEKAIQLFSALLQMERVDSLTYYNLAVCHARRKMGARVADVLAQASARYGRSFVGNWIAASDFDPVRDDPAFKTLVAELGTPAPAGAKP